MDSRSRVQGVTTWIGKGAGLGFTVSRAGEERDCDLGLRVYGSGVKV